MKCPNCSAELNEHAKFCPNCGIPIESTPTQKMNDFPSDYDPVNRPSYGDNDGVFRGEVNRYPAENYPLPDRNGNGSKPPKSRKKTALILSIVALVLVIAIVGGVIFFVNRNTVSAKELEEAKENYLPPAQAVPIDTSLDDPSNDKIQFKYDDRARIISCAYSVNDKAYDQRYTYDDAQRRISIETYYRDHPIFTKDIEYDRANKPNAFEDVDGYYIRLDDQCFDDEPSPSSSKAPETAEPETEEPTSEPTEEPTDPPTDWRDLYIDYLNSISVDYSSGTLLYINDDDTPELVLYTTAAAAPTYICYISDNSVQSFATGMSEGISYAKKTGYFTSGRMRFGTYSGIIYYFDGNTVSEEHNLSSTDINKGDYEVDGESMSSDEYEAFIDYYSFTEPDSEFTSKNTLPDYIRNFE